MTVRGLLTRPSGFLPIAMSVLALGIVGWHVATVGIAPQVDEGTDVHLWQLLMAGQLPAVVYFALRWLAQAPRQAIPVLGLQVAAAIAAAAPVALLGF